MKHYIRIRTNWKLTYEEGFGPLNMSKWTLYLRKVPHQLGVF